MQQTSADILLYKIIPFLNGNNQLKYRDEAEECAQSYVKWIQENLGKRLGDLKEYIEVPFDVLSQRSSRPEQYMKTVTVTVDNDNLYFYLIFVKVGILSFNAYEHLTGDSLRNYVRVYCLRKCVTEARANKKNEEEEREEKSS